MESIIELIVLLIVGFLGGVAGFKLFRKTRPPKSGQTVERIKKDLDLQLEHSREEIKSLSDQALADAFVQKVKRRRNERNKSNQMDDPPDFDPDEFSLKR